MRAILFYIICLPFCITTLQAAAPPAHSSHTLLTLKKKVIQGHVGDYIVTEEGKNTTLLMIRALSPETLYLEQITAPTRKIDKSKSWQEWIDEKAPGYTSWIVYEIDLIQNKIAGSFSFIKNENLFVNQTDYLFANLMSLPLEPIPDSQKKRIGPPPTGGELDRRGIWLPSLVFNGKKKQQPLFDVRRATWPQDETLLSGSTIELYFDQENTSFPFPYWIEIKSTHYAFNLKIVDSGKELHSYQQTVHTPPLQ